MDTRQRWWVQCLASPDVEIWGLGEGDREILGVPPQRALWSKTDRENILGLVVEENITPYILKKV